jgi:hypothetical protein
MRDGHARAFFKLFFQGSPAARRLDFAQAVFMDQSCIFTLRETFLMYCMRL